MMSVKCPGGLGAGPQRGLGQRPRGPNYYIIIIHLYILYIDHGSLCGCLLIIKIVLFHQKNYHIDK